MPSTSTSTATILQHYIVDMSSNNNFVQMPAIEGDSDDVRYIEVELYDNGLQFDPSGYNPTIIGTTAAGGTIWNNGSITSKGYLLFEITEAMMTTAGRGIYQIALFKDNDPVQLKSFPFYIVVTKSAIDPSEIIESNEFKVLTELIAEVEALHIDAEAFAERAEAAAASANTSKTQAATSATSAAASATSAANSASSASTSAQTATEKASNAATSATNASASETNAAASATSASSSATNAAASAASALSSKNAAATSEANAATSETNAATSETNAALSASNASTSETNAAVSEANAATSEANAAISETNAATSESNAATSETNAHNYAILAESYAQGGTNTRPGENTANAKYYKEQCESIYDHIGSSIVPMGTIYFADLANVTPHTGYSYNIIDAFVTTSDFKGGAGIHVDAGATVYRTGDGYWDILPGGLVTGIKGEAESSFRVGNVEITKANLGIANAVNVVISSTEPSQSENDYWIQDYN